MGKKGQRLEVFRVVRLTEQDQWDAEFLRELWGLRSHSALFRALLREAVRQVEVERKQRVEHLAEVRDRRQKATRRRKRR